MASSSILLRGKSPSIVRPARWMGRPGSCAPTIVVDVADWVPRKLAVLRCHRTQMGPTNPFAQIDQVQARRWLGIEHFRRSPISLVASVLERIGSPVVSS